MHKGARTPASHRPEWGQAATKATLQPITRLRLITATQGSSREALQPFTLERLLGLIFSWMQCTLIPADEGPEHKPKVLFASSKMPAPVHVWRHLHHNQWERNHFSYRAPQGTALILIFPSLTFLISSLTFFDDCYLFLSYCSISIGELLSSLLPPDLQDASIS